MVGAAKRSDGCHLNVGELDALPARAHLCHIVGRSHCRCLLHRYELSSEWRHKHRDNPKHLSREHERRQTALAVERKRRVHLSHIALLNPVLRGAVLVIESPRARVPSVSSSAATLIRASSEVANLECGRTAIELSTTQSYTPAVPP